MALDVVVVERRMRRAYEFGRIKHAAAQSVPLFALTGIALYVGPLRGLDIAVASLLAATALLYRWLGQLAERTLQPGIVAGLFPLVLALTANAVSPGCAHGNALSLCALACAMGGVVAALHLTRFARTEGNERAAFWLAVLPTLLLGSLGCGCIGFTGVMAMTGALFVGSLPALLRWA